MFFFFFFFWIQQVVSQFNAFKLKKEPYNHRFYVYKISDDATQIVIDCYGEKSSTYDNFVEKLPPNECRYAIFDLDYTTKDGRPGNKVCYSKSMSETQDIETASFRLTKPVCMWL